MKTNNFSAKSIGFAAALMLSSVPGKALVIGDTAGIWRVINFSTPNRLTVQTDGNRIVTGIDEAEHFENSTGSITVQPNGSFAGSAPDPISGTISLGGHGELIITANGGDGTQVLTFHVNRTADFIVTCKTEPEGFNDLILALRAPAALQASDLAGRWNATALKTPYQLVLERNSSNQVINIRGLDTFGVFGGVLNIETNGTFSGQIEDAFTGAIDSASNGLVNITVNGGEGSQQLTLFINASKDVMALLESRYDANDNYQEIMIFQKAPTNNVAADLAGNWRIAMFDVPIMTQVKDGFGRVTGLGGSTSFQAARQSLVSGHDGFFVARVDNIATGTLSPSGTGLLTVNVQSEEGAETFGFQLNSTQTLLGSSRSIGDGYEFLLVTKSPPPSGVTRDFGLFGSSSGAGMTLQWAAITNGGLQVSTDLATWQAIPGTVGQHSYAVPATAPISFYRAAEFTP